MICFIAEIYLIWRNNVTLAFREDAKARQNLALLAGGVGGGMGFEGDAASIGVMLHMIRLCRRRR